MTQQEHAQIIIGIMYEALMEISDPHSVCDPSMLAGFALKRVLDLDSPVSAKPEDKRPRIDLHAFNGA